MAYVVSNFFYLGIVKTYFRLSRSLTLSPFLSSLGCQSAALSRVFMLDQF